MAIERFAGFMPVCDRCGKGEPFAPDDLFSGYVADSESEAREWVEGLEGRVDSDGTTTCFECLEAEIRAEMVAARAKGSEEA